MSFIERIKEMFGIYNEPIIEEFTLIEGDYLQHAEETWRKYNKEGWEEIESYIQNKKIENIEKISHAELLSKIRYYAHRERFFGEHSRYELQFYGAELNRRLGGKSKEIIETVINLLLSPESKERNDDIEILATEIRNGLLENNNGENTMNTTPEITIERTPLQGEGSIIELLDVDTVDKTIKVYRSDFIDLIDGHWFEQPAKILEFAFDDEEEFMEASDEEVEERVKQEVENEFFSEDAAYPFYRFIEEYGIEIKGHDIRDFEISFEGEITQFDGIKDEIEEYLDN